MLYVNKCKFVSIVFFYFFCVVVVYVVLLFLFSLLFVLLLFANIYRIALVNAMPKPPRLIQRPRILSKFSQLNEEGPA